MAEKLIRIEEIRMRRENNLDRVQKYFDERDSGKITESQLKNILALMLTAEQYHGERDHLTNLRNRKAFDVLIQSLVESDTPFGLIIADIDHFKSFNDTYGHKTGDKVLIEVAQTIAKAARDVDIVCRWGGEEIGILGVFEKKDEVAGACKRLRKAVESIDVTKIEPKFLGNITISLGAGIYKKSAKDTFFEEVDAKLYESKESGRNKYTIVE